MNWLAFSNRIWLLSSDIATVSILFVVLSAALGIIGALFYKSRALCILTVASSVLNRLLWPMWYEKFMGY